MKKIKIAKKAFAAKGNEDIKELFVCSDGECYTNEGGAVNHARAVDCEYLGSIKRQETEGVSDEDLEKLKLKAIELAEKEAAELAAKELAEKEAAELAAKELAEKEAADKAAKKK